MNRDEPSERGRAWIAAALLGLLTFGLYASTRTFDFVNYDDPDYVSSNARVLAGLDAGNVRWAFGYHAANWHPLTWLSHMLDVELFGPRPGPMHLENAGLHALAAALLALALTRLTGRARPAFLVALLFAVHPLRVQCVAWIAERKELLAAVFFCAALLCYADFARTRRSGAWVGTLLCLVLGGMAKPVLVTAPAVLLLLDVWPLARFQARPGGTPRGAPWLEKLPLFALALGLCALTLAAQRAGGSVGELAGLPLSARILNAGQGVLQYVRASAWPSGLCAYHPHPAITGDDVRLPGAAGLVLVLGLSLAAWSCRRRSGALFTGWFWFLGMLVPVLGLVQVGEQAWAERYAYLPTIGLYIALVFGLDTALAARPAARTAAFLAGCGAALALALVTLHTLPQWRDSRALFERALAVDERSHIAHNNLGLVLLEQRQWSRALEHFQRAQELSPRFAAARYNTALAQEGLGRFTAAAASFQSFLALRPGHPEAQRHLAALARASERAEEPRARLEAACRARPDDPEAHLALAQQLLRLGEREEARARFQTVEGLRPGDPQVQLGLGVIALQEGRPAEARARLEQALERMPGSAVVLNHLAAAHEALGEWSQALARYEQGFSRGAWVPTAARAAAWILATGPDESLVSGARALELARYALAQGAPDALEVLAAAQARAGDFEAAVRAQEEVLAGASTARARALQAERLELYRSGRAYTRAP